MDWQKAFRGHAPSHYIKFENIYQEKAIFDYKEGRICDMILFACEGEIGEKETWFF